MALRSEKMNTMKRILGVLLLTWVTEFAAAQSPQVFTTKEGAIRGFDPVAFFKEGKPVVGKKDFALEWNEATWYFSTAGNRDEFRADPEKFAPQYGGYCAYGTAEGHKAPTLTETWSIVNGKLYFNYNKSVQVTWKSNQAEFIRKADQNWPKIKDR